MSENGERTVSSDEEPLQLDHTQIEECEQPSGA